MDYLDLLQKINNKLNNLELQVYINKKRNELDIHDPKMILDNEYAQ